ncbi:MAG: MBL fold metallo-hydrolase [Pirellulaceae bacterium]
MKVPATKSIEGKWVLLGTGTSVGVPAIGCGCAVCQSGDPLNRRTRCSAIVGLPNGNLLIDTPPDLRTQLLRERIGLVHSVLFTHEHTDHLMGLDDLRLFQFYLEGPVHLYCEASVERRIRTVFDYAFHSVEPTHRGSCPNLEFHAIAPLETVSVLGGEVVPVRLHHGPRFDVLGFRLGNNAYCTDVKEMPPETKRQLAGLEVLVLDALRPIPHPTHLSLDEAVELARELGARQTYFTHISCRLDHSSTNAKLPPGMALAYDGLSFPA